MQIPLEVDQHFCVVNLYLETSLAENVVIRINVCVRLVNNNVNQHFINKARAIRIQQHLLESVDVFTRFGGRLLY